MMQIEESEIRQVMEVVFGYTDYKCIAQREAVQVVLGGSKNVVISMPTNSGKSLGFQLASLFQQRKDKEDKTLLIVSPNLSLIRNQRKFLKARDMGEKLLSENINHLTPYDDRDEIRSLLLTEAGTVKFLFLCPEMVFNKDKGRYDETIMAMLRCNLISHVVIDEVHSVIDSFRSLSFEKMKNIRQENPEVPFIALTTASKAAIDEMADKTGMSEGLTIVQASSERTNIFYDVVESFDFFAFMESVDPNFDRQQPKQTPRGIIYCKLIDHVERVTSMLEEMNVPVTCFYGTLENRFDNDDDWDKNLYRVMVATSESYGLGIKKDIKFVLHYGRPKNLRAYYQESGRLGTEVKGRARIYNFENPFCSGNIKGYCATAMCRRQYMAEHFGDTIEPCVTQCDNCLMLFRQL